MTTAGELEENTLHKPAVGLVATEGNMDALIRAITLARERGHTVFVLHDDPGDFDMGELVQRLGARSVELLDDIDDEQTLHQILTIRARNSGFPGILIHPSPEEYIDYDSSMQAFESTSEYAVTARTRQTLTDETDDVIIGIPAYNEASSIDRVVREVSRYADHVLVVDDGSRDETAEIARDRGATVIEHEQNRGYGAALQTIFDAARDTNATVLVVLDGDGQHDPSDIPTLVEQLETSEADIAIGSRFVDETDSDLPLYRRFGIAVVNLLTNLSMGVVRSRIKDTQSGFRAYDSDAIESLADDDRIGDQMSASTDILYHAYRHDYDVIEVGTTVDYDVENANNRNPVLHGLNLVNNILRTIERKRPITALGIPGFTVAMVGLGFGYWTILNFVTTQTFPIGLAIVSVFATLLGIFACFTAIILHSLTTHIRSVDS